MRTHRCPRRYLLYISVQPGTGGREQLPQIFLSSNLLVLSILRFNFKKTKGICYHVHGSCWYEDSEHSRKILLISTTIDLISQKLSFCIPISHFKLSISLTNFFFVTLFFIHFQKSGRLGSVLRNKM